MSKDLGNDTIPGMGDGLTQIKSTGVPNGDLERFPWVAINEDAVNFQAISFGRSSFLNYLSGGISGNRLPQEIEFVVSVTTIGTENHFKVTANFSEVEVITSLQGKFPCPRDCSQYFPITITSNLNVILPLKSTFYVNHILKVLSHPECTHLILRIFAVPNMVNTFKLGMYPGKIKEDLTFEQYRTAAGYVFKPL